jgi:hypothetical protein
MRRRGPGTARIVTLVAPARRSGPVVAATLAIATLLAACTSSHRPAGGIPTDYPPSHATDYRVATTCGTAAPTRHDAHPPITEAYLDSFAMLAKRTVPSAMVGGEWVNGPKGGRRRLRLFATDPVPVQKVLSRMPKVDCYRMSLYVVPYSMPHLAALDQRLHHQLTRAHVVLAQEWADQATDRVEIDVPSTADANCPQGASAVTVANPEANYQRVWKIVAPYAPQVVVRGAKPMCFAPAEGVIDGAN